MDTITPAYLERQTGTLQNARAICLETNLPADAINWFLAQEWEVPLYLDPVSDRLSVKINKQLGKFHTIKANRRQAEILSGQRILQPKDLESIAQQWLKEGVQRVFITLGNQGAFVANQAQQLHIPAAKVPVVNTTGAGDAFYAGVLWASLRKWPLEDCCRAGLAASTVAVRSTTAINPELNEASLLEHIKKFC
jgi:pseudouridine kinase